MRSSTSRSPSSSLVFAMVERYHALISCAHVWPFIGTYESRLASAGIEYDIPQVKGQQLEEGDLIPIIDRYDGILAGDDALSAQVLAKATQLKVISKWGIGVDAIDVEYAETHGIRVLNTPGVFGHELADYALGYLLLLARRQHEVDREVRSGRWHKVKGTSLQGKTAGLFGLGSSGRELARRLHVMGLRVLAVDPVPPPKAFLNETKTQMVGWNELLDQSDIISLHAPATADTTHIIDETALLAMKPGVWLLNTSRGALIDEHALLDALDRGIVAAAALDVFESEPLDPHHPLTQYPNVVLGSHNGSNTQEATERTTELAMSNLIEGLSESAPR